MTGISRHHSIVGETTGGPLRPGGLALTAHGLEKLGLGPGARVLDAGCGFGSSLELFLEKGFAPVGMDLSLPNLAETAGHVPEARILSGDICRIPLAGSCLDAVVCECVLSLAQSPSRALSEFQRVLVPGGKLLLSDIYSRAGGFSPIENGQAQTCLANMRSLDELQSLLAGAGFSVLEMEDHTAGLNQLAGQMIFDHGTMDGFWSSCLKDDCCQDRIRAARPGYILIAAEKES